MSFQNMMTSINPAPLTQPRRSREALPPPGSEWATLAPSAPWETQPHLAAPPLMPMPLPIHTLPAHNLPVQRNEYPPRPYVTEEPPKAPKPRGTKRVKRQESSIQGADDRHNNDDDGGPSSSQPTRSSNSNAARNARNAAARAEREQRKQAADVVPDTNTGGSGRGRERGQPAGSERGRSERGGSEIMMGDDSAGPKVGGDRVAVGVVDGMRYHVDFSTLPTATIFDYLERNKALPPFGTQFIRNPFDPDARACDPRKLYSYPTIEEPVAPHPLMQHLPGTQPPGVAAASVGHTPYGLGIGIGPGVPVPREERRRFRRVREEEGGGEGAEGDATNEDGDDAKQLSENGKEGSVRGDSAQDDGHAKPAEEPGMDIDEEDYETPALRRSNRRPGASTLRRPSPSPTPSSSSSTSGTRYRPILPDLDLAHNVFAERATKDWCQALASGGGQTVQGPGVNPASAGQVMMGGTGGMQREGEVVADFLYAIRVKERALKIAHEPAHAMFQNMF